LQCELRALPAVRVKPGAEQGSLLCDELDARGTERSLCPAAQPTASRSRALAAPRERCSLDAKVFVPKLASSDELKSPFSEASFVTALRFFVSRVLDIQGTEGTERGRSGGEIRRGGTYLRDNMRNSEGNRKGNAKASHAPRRKLQKGRPESSSARKRGEVKHRLALFHRATKNLTVGSRRMVSQTGLRVIESIAPTKPEDLPPHVESYKRVGSKVALGRSPSRERWD
jgi:hypothetical protein